MKPKPVPCLYCADNQVKTTFPTTALLHAHYAACRYLAAAKRLRRGRRKAVAHCIWFKRRDGSRFYLTGGQVYAKDWRTVRLLQKRWDNKDQQSEVTAVSTKTTGSLHAVKLFSNGEEVGRVYVQVPAVARFIRDLVWRKRVGFAAEIKRWV